MQNVQRGALASCALVALATLGGLLLDGPASSAPNAGFIYVMTNLPGGNSVAVFSQANNGTLTPGGVFPTGGLGFVTGQPDPLGAQSSLVAENQFLHAVNAGSNEVSVLQAVGAQLSLVSKRGTVGVRPTSLAVRKGLLYVQNAGSGTIEAFRVSQAGLLTPVPHSSKTLSGGAGADPARVAFAPRRRIALVTDKQPNMIDVFIINSNRIPEGPFATGSNGQTPSGFAFDSAGNMIVSEAFDGAPNGSALSSYSVGENASVNVISGSVPNGQTSASRVVTTGNGAFAYVCNRDSGSISSYSILPGGALQLRQSVAAVTSPGGFPVDMTLDLTSQFLYVLVNVTGTINVFSVAPNGSLTLVQSLGGLPPYAQGIVAR
jgi:6-phosphogluconolactonase (cycloisomerase 2 family)